jgi:hypothetical protein
MDLASGRSAARRLGLRRGEDLQTKLFVEHSDFVLRRAHKQPEIAGRGKQMLEASQELLAGGNCESKRLEPVSGTHMFGSQARPTPSVTKPSHP